MGLAGTKVTVAVTAPQLDSPRTVERTVLIESDPSIIEIPDISVDDVRGDTWDVIPATFDFSNDRLSLTFLSSGSFTDVGSSGFNGYLIQFKAPAKTSVARFELENNTSAITIDEITGIRTNQLAINVSGLAHRIDTGLSLLLGFDMLGNKTAETLRGGDGDDDINGAAGADSLIGAGGADQLKGGDGKDRFIYQALSDSAQTARDTIMDFNGMAGDRLDLSALDANSKRSGNQEFTFVGNKAFSRTPGQLRFAGESGILSADVNGDGQSDFSIAIRDLATVRSQWLIL